MNAESKAHTNGGSRAPMEARLEILSVELLERRRDLANELRSLSGGLGIPLGWHYLLDLIWIIERVEEADPRRILDAGAGTGLIQWYLAEQGRTVLSIDRSTRRRLPLHLRRRYGMEAHAPGDLSPPFIGLLGRESLAASLRYWRSGELRGRAAGKVILHRGDLTNLERVAAGSVDAVVSVSALEHNDPEHLIRIVSELFRVLKPGGPLVATLAAARDGDWFHQPSHGWCYTEVALRRAFSVPDEVASNYARFDELIAALRANEELRVGLDRSYFRSGSNGMPWGRWDPMYQPVGVCVWKPV